MQQDIALIKGVLWHRHFTSVIEHPVAASVLFARQLCYIFLARRTSLEGSKSYRTSRHRTDIDPAKLCCSKSKPKAGYYQR